LPWAAARTVWLPAQPAAGRPRACDASPCSALLHVNDARRKSLFARRLARQGRTAITRARRTLHPAVAARLYPVPRGTEHPPERALRKREAHGSAAGWIICREVARNRLGDPALQTGPMRRSAPGAIDKIAQGMGRVAKLVEIGRRGSEGMVWLIRRRGQGRRVSGRGWASHRPGAW
jgi:hypothetical protein